MIKKNSATLDSLGFQSYPKKELNNLFLAFRNTEPDVFFITDMTKLTEDPGVTFRIQLLEKIKCFSKKIYYLKLNHLQQLKPVLMAVITMVTAKWWRILNSIKYFLFQKVRTMHY
jgi:hypothetical protein